MNKFLCAASLAISATTASASTIDFTTTDFASTFPALGDATVVSVTIDGVSFSITAEARGVDGVRQAFDNTGLSFGLPGNGMYSISVVADSDVTYQSLTGEDRTLLSFSSQALFTTSLAGLQQEGSIATPTSFGLVDLVDVEAAAGEAFVLAFDFTDRTGFNSIFSQAVIQSLDFEVTDIAPVPLPAGGALMLVGMGALALMRRKTA